MSRGEDRGIRKGTVQFMKKSTRALSGICAALLAAGPMTLSGPIPGLAQSGNIPDRTLFATSFESADPAPKESAADNGFFKNVRAYRRVSELDGEFTGRVVSDSIDGSPDFKSEESKPMLFDGSPDTKFLTVEPPSQENPVWVSFSFPSAVSVGVYSLTSANDEEGRDPKDWVLLGSTDGKDYVEIDRQRDQSFAGRKQAVSYKIKNPAAYRYYRLEITANHGAEMTQIADLRMGTGVASGTSAKESPMTSEVTAGPGDAYCASGAFDGSSVLSVYGEQTAKSETYCRNLLYSGLNIPVSAHTNLSYVHFPAVASGSYDYEYTSMFMSLDVKFTDGSYLSDLAATDQNGFGMDPVSKGESDALYTRQWNYVETCLGDVARGKTIDSLYVYFRMDRTGTASKFLAYFDDVRIEDKTPVTYEHLSDYVNTLRGTNCTTSFSRGLTTPFAAMPNGFNFFTPVTEIGSNQPYQYLSDTIYHFSVSHVPSTWVGDYGTWQFMANTSVDIGAMSDSDISARNVGATFDHANETAKGHYYSVTFDEGSKASGVKAEITPTVHGVYVRFTFPKDSENVNVIFDCVRAGGSVSVNADGSFSATSNHTQNGSSSLKISGAFDQKPESFKKVDGKSAIVSFPKGTGQVTMKFATSFLSQDQAAHNLELEIPAGENFDSIFEKAQAAWDEKCGLIEIEGASYTRMVTFYSCMYRLYSYPNLYSENKGTNENPEWVYASPYQNGRETAGKLYVNNGFWDTYRTAWAAYALLTPTLDGELLDGLLTHYRDNSWIPRWVAPGGTSSMIGTSSDILFADAYVKGIKFDWDAAYESMLRNASTVSSNTANGGREENNTAPYTGYVSNAVSAGFSWSMEDYISDYCIGVMSEKLGKTSEAWYYYNRAKYYTLLYNSDAGFFMGRDAAGNWSSGPDYDPANWWGDYTETNGWTMTFAPVFDAGGLAAIYGGKEGLAAKLDAYFDNSVSAMKKVQVGTIHEMVEARELRLGQYGHSNQPAHAIPYLYAYAGQSYKTQALVRDILTRLYVGSEIGQGYCGDEDNGEMSGWYILSSLGIYPQSMGSGQYIIGSPLFDKATVHLEGGKDLVIIAENNSPENCYIQSATFNGKDFNQSFIEHSQIAAGGTLIFKMGGQPSAFGTGSDPKSLTPMGQSAALTTDLATPKAGRGGLTVTAGEFNPDANCVTCVGVTNYRNLFDNNSKTVATLAAGSEIYWSWNQPTSLKAVTITGDVRKSGPKSFELEASNDGVIWKSLTGAGNLKFSWESFILPFAVPEENAGLYRYYRLSFPQGGKAGEIEFLGDIVEGGTLTEITDGQTADPSGTAGSEGPGGTAPDTSSTGGPGEQSGNGGGILPWILIGCGVIAAAAAVVIVIVVRKKKKSS